MLNDRRLCGIRYDLVEIILIRNHQYHLKNTCLYLVVERKVNMQLLVLAVNHVAGISHFSTSWDLTGDISAFFVKELLFSGIRSGGVGYKDLSIAGVILR